MKLFTSTNDPAREGTASDDVQQPMRHVKSRRNSPWWDALHPTKGWRKLRTPHASELLCPCCRARPRHLEKCC